MDIIVSCCLITYNHVNYVRQAIESILMQETDVNFEIIIADDCSTDGTKEIIQEYFEKYPEKIRLLPRKTNVGALVNFLELIGSATGKFVAYLEGDDYWTDKFKLDKQVKYLLQNDDIAISSHDCKTELNGVLIPFSRSNYYRNFPLTNVFELKEYLLNDFFHSSSIVYRKDCLKEIPDWYLKCKGGDYFLVLMIALNGKIHYINECLSVYRRNPDSISHHSSRIEIYENFKVSLDNFDVYSGKKYSKLVEKRKFVILYYVMYYYPKYFAKLKFGIMNFSKIVGMDKRVISVLGRYKCFVPLWVLKEKVDIYKKIEKK